MSTGLCSTVSNALIISHQKPNKHPNFRLLSNNYAHSAEHFKFRVQASTKVCN